VDKAEYRIKLEQINSLAEAGDFKGAAAVVDTIDWRHVKSVRTLCMVGEIYEANKRYEDSKRVLQYAYKRSSISKTVLYRLAEINIRTGDYDEAKRYYHEFEQLSPNDTSRYILKYKLLKAEGAALDDQIAVLKEYKEREYTERWAYELAKLYMKNGQKQKCIEECDEMIL
jgi:tetratricopeptide (TPR) repeat protein